MKKTNEIGLSIHLGKVGLKLPSYYLFSEIDKPFQDLIYLFS